MVQLVLDAPQLAPYWHVDERPERAPLELEISADLVTFAASHGRALPRLVKFDQPVILRNTPPAPGDRPWEQRFRVRLEMAADVATVELHYPVEGLHGKAKLVKTSGVWRVEQLTVAEQ